MIIESVTSPVYSSADHSSVDCMVKFAGFAAPIPFTARASDSEDHGRQLYTAIVGGAHGSVGAYVAPTPTPNGAGFVQAVKGGIGGVVAANQLARAYPLFIEAIRVGEWADVAALLIDGKNTGVLSQQHYDAIKQAAAAFNIPVTLP